MEWHDTIIKAVASCVRVWDLMKGRKKEGARNLQSCGIRFVHRPPLNKGRAISPRSYGDGDCLRLFLLPSRSLGLVNRLLRNLLLLLDVFKLLLHILRLVKCDASVMAVGAHTPCLWRLHIN